MAVLLLLSFYLAGASASAYSKPDPRCKFLGHFLPTLGGDRCSYLVCGYGSEPWKDPYTKKIAFFTDRQPCAPGTAVSEYYQGGYTLPCTTLSNICTPMNTKKDGGYPKPSYSASNSYLSQSHGSSGYGSSGYGSSSYGSSRRMNKYLPGPKLPPPFPGRFHHGGFPGPKIPLGYADKAFGIHGQGYGKSAPLRVGLDRRDNLYHQPLHDLPNHVKLDDSPAQGRLYGYEGPIRPGYTKESIYKKLAEYKNPGYQERSPEKFLKAYGLKLPVGYDKNFGRKDPAYAPFNIYGRDPYDSPPRPGYDLDKYSSAYKGQRKFLF